MLTFTEAELQAWITPLLWPFLRALALFTSLPVLGQRVVPVRVRIALAFFIAVASQATLPPIATAVGLGTGSASTRSMLPSAANRTTLQPPRSAAQTPPDASTAKPPTRPEPLGTVVSRRTGP